MDSPSRIVIRGHRGIMRDFRQDVEVGAPCHRGGLNGGLRQGPDSEQPTGLHGGFGSYFQAGSETPSALRGEAR